MLTRGPRCDEVLRKSERVFINIPKTASNIDWDDKRSGSKARSQIQTTVRPVDGALFARLRDLRLAVAKEQEPLHPGHFNAASPASRPMIAASSAAWR